MDTHNQSRLGSGVVRKKLISVPIAELTTVRLICASNGCPGIVEMPIARLKPADQYIRPLECPLCGNGFRDDVAPPGDRLSRLAQAIGDLKKATRIQVEFVIPDDGPD